MRLLLSKVVRLAAAATLAASQAMAAELAAPADVPVDAFFNVQDMSEPVLSPEGDALANVNSWPVAISKRCPRLHRQPIPETRNSYRPDAS